MLPNLMASCLAIYSPAVALKFGALFAQLARHSSSSHHTILAVSTNFSTRFAGGISIQRLGGSQALA